MTSAIELLFDERLDGQVRDLWRRLGDLDLSTPDRWSASHRPHLSLGVCDSLDAREPAPLGGLTRPLQGLPVRMESTGWFTGGVLHLTPAWSTTLGEAQQAAWDWLLTRAVSPWDEYVPGRWLPHCTLAVHVDPVLVPAALAVVGDFVPLSGTIRGVGIGVNGRLEHFTDWTPAL